MRQSLTRFFRLCALGMMLVACAPGPPLVVQTAPPPYQPPSQPIEVAPPPQGPFQPNEFLQLCNGFSVSNPPPFDQALWVIDFKPIIVVDGIVMATVPGNEVCLSSGYGLRRGRPHHGIDVSARPAPAVYSAAPGRIIEARVSRGYGNQILIDHGRGVYTRYAHLEFFDPSVAVGRDVGFGQPLGRMGRSGNATGIHLHFEILTGNYRNPRASKGLTPRDPFSFPAYTGF